MSRMMTGVSENCCGKGIPYQKSPYTSTYAK
jgi:hypothetical protein